MTDYPEPGVIESTATDLVVQPAATDTNLFHVTEPVEVIAQASKVADVLKDVLKRQGLTARIGGNEHVLVEGWTTCGAMLGVVPVVEWTRQTEDGGWEARVEARTMDGRTIGAAEASCSRDEKMWKNRDSYALRSMAQTRATSKALRGPLGFIVTLAGFQATPAEDMPSDQQPEYGRPYDQQIGKQAGAACVALRGGDAQAGVSLWKEITAKLGYMPQAAVVALLAAAGEQS